MKTVLAHGVFDLLHVGHVAHLMNARKYGDYLVVSVVPDRFITKQRPIIYDETDRVALLSALRCVDKVLLCNAKGPESVIEELRPDIYVRGHAYTNQWMPESALLQRLNIPVRYTEESSPHTTDIIKKIIDLCR